MCFHNSMSVKAIKLAARYGRKSDVVEIYQDELLHHNLYYKVEILQTNIYNKTIYANGTKNKKPRFKEPELLHKQ